MRFVAAVLFVLTLPSALFGLEIKGPKTMPQGAGFIVLEAISDDPVKWVVIPNTGNFLEIEDGHRAIFGPGNVVGTWTFVAASVGKAGDLQLVQHAVLVGGVDPNPTPPPGPVPPSPNPTPTPGPAPVPPSPVPVPLPSAELQTILAPVKAIMDRSDRVKAAKFKDAWEDFAVVLRTENAPMTVARFKSAIKSFVGAASAKAGLGNAFPGFSVAFNTAFDQAMGTQDVALEQAKAVAFVEALAWACGDPPVRRFGR